MRFLIAISASMMLANTVYSQTQLLVRVEGEGYLRFVRDAKTVYAKTARLVVIEGKLADVSGAKLAPAVETNSLKGLQIDLEGRITCGQQEIGRLVLAVFPESLAGFDTSGFASAASRPKLANPGEGTLGVIRTGLPANNAKPVAETTTKSVLPIKKEEPKLESLSADVPKVNPSSTTVTIKDRAEVETDTFTLGQIASLKGADKSVTLLEHISMGDTPPFGIDRVFDRERILIKIRAAGLDAKDITLVGPEKIRVTRKGQKLTHDQFVEAAVRGAKVKGYAAGLDSLLPGPDMMVPVGEQDLVCESLTKGEAGLTATVGVYIDGKRFNSRTIRLKSTGQALDLKQGATVKVKVSSGAVSIQASGKVVKVDQTTGTVTVLISDTGALLTGKVLPDGSIEVKA